MDWTNLKVKKLNKTTRGLVGNVTVHKPLDKSYLVEIAFFLKQGGEYRKSPYKLAKRSIYDFLKDDEYFYPDMAKVSNFPYPAVDPFPKVSS